VQNLLWSQHASQTAASGTAVCAALAQRLQRPLVLEGEGSREFAASWRRLAGSDLFLVANMAEEPADLRLRPQAAGPVTVWDPDTGEWFASKPSEQGAFAWHFEPWQAFVVTVGNEGDAVGGAECGASGPLRPAPLWLSADTTDILSGDWDFRPEPGNMLRLSLQARPDPGNQGAVLGWHRDGEAEEGWVTPEGDRLPEAIRPAEAPWYWLRARVICEAGARPRRLVADNPDFLEAFVNGKPARQVPGEALWAEENVHFDVTGSLAEGENLITLRARTSKYNDPRIGPMPGVIDRLLQPVVLVGEFAVGEGERLLPWSGRLSPEAPWEALDLPHFGGVGTYRRTIRLAACERTLLHLPACAEAVEVFLNGASCGVRAWYPYAFDLTPQAREGENLLEVRVRNTLGNLIRQTYGGSGPLRWPRSGLLAPPRLLAVR